MISITFVIETDENGNVKGSSFGKEGNYTIFEAVAMGLALKKKGEAFLEDIPQELLGDIIITEASGNA